MVCILYYSASQSLGYLPYYKMNEFLLWKLIRDDHILRENLCNMVSRSHLFQAFVLIFRTHTANMAGEETEETNADLNTDAETTGNPNASISTAEGDVLGVAQNGCVAGVPTVILHSEQNVQVIH